MNTEGKREHSERTDRRQGWSRWLPK